MNNLEMRSHKGLKFRAQQEAGKKKIAGYFSVFDIVYQVESWLFEIMRNTAFDQALALVARGERLVKALYQHNIENVLGSTKSQTLQLSTDTKGLWGEIDPPNNPLGQNVVEWMNRGDVDEASIGFFYVSTKWTQGEKADTIEVLEADLVECSVANFPKNQSAVLGLRARLPKEVEDKDLVCRALNRYVQKLDPTSDDREVLLQHRSLIEPILPEDMRELFKRSLPAPRTVHADKARAYLDLISIDY